MEFVRCPLLIWTVLFGHYFTVPWAPSSLAIAFPPLLPILSSNCLHWISSVQGGERSQNSSSDVVTVLCYGLDNAEIGVWLPVVTWDFSLFHGIQTGSEAHPVAQPMGTGNIFLRYGGWGSKLITYLHLLLWLITRAATNTPPPNMSPCSVALFSTEKPSPLPKPNFLHCLSEFRVQISSMNDDSVDSTRVSSLCFYLLTFISAYWQTGSNF